MKKNLILKPIIGLTTACGVFAPLSSCSNKTVDTNVIPTEGLSIKDVTLHGFKEDFEYKNYSKLVIPSNVKVIDTDAFNGLLNTSTKITEVVIPGNVETIKKGAFAANNNITLYDFSQYTVDQMYALTVESGAFALDENGIYSFVKMNEDWTDVEKTALKNKLIAGGIPAYCFVKQTEGNVEASKAKEKEQLANGGEATNVFTVNGHYSQTLKYEAILTTIDASEGVDVEHNVTCTTSEDFKTVNVNVEMHKTDEQHTFSNDDYVTYKVTLICYTVNETTGDLTAQWSETLQTFKVTYHNILDSIVSIVEPAKNTYRVGETFDATGLSAKVKYSNGDEKTIAWGDANLSTSYDGHIFTMNDLEEAKKTAQKSLQVSAIYKLEGIQKEKTFNTYMDRSLEKIEITNNPTTLEFKVGQTFNSEGLELKATYNDETIQEGITSGYTTDLDGHKFVESEIGDKTVTVTYSEGSISKTVTYDIEIKKAVAPFKDTEWEVITEAATTFEKSTQDATAMKALCNAFEDVSYIEEIGPSITDTNLQIEAHLANFIGKTNEITINNKKHTFKVIGINHDVINDTSELTGKRATFTFELDGLLSDSSGDRLEIEWGGLTNYSIENSYCYKNLNDTSSVVWYKTGGSSKSDVNKSAYTLLTDAGIAPKKVKKSFHSSSIMTYDCYCFGLTCTEFNQTHQYASSVEGSKYYYWNNKTTLSDWVKRDLNNMASAYHISSRYTNDTANVWTISDNGALAYIHISNRDGISFAFCI